MRTALATRSSIAPLTGVLLLSFVFASPATVAQDAASIECDDGNGGLSLPPDFCAVVFADGIGVARHLVVASNGDVYVALQDAPDGSTVGGIVGLRDTDGDGRADLDARFGEHQGNGIALVDGVLYFAPHDSVVRYQLDGDGLRPSGPPETVVSNLPSTPDHYNKTVVVDGSGALYLNIGSATNACQVVNRMPGSPGIDPCPELDHRAGVWRFDSTKRDQSRSDGAHIGIGTRNMVALAIEPETGALYGVQLGRDQLSDNWPDLYTPEQDLVLPAEELFRIEEGKDYGWPYCYYDAQLGRKVLAPEYGGDGSMAGDCASKEPPLDTFPAHWAPLAMLFYTGDQFPAEYRGGAFVSFHGSQFDPVNQPDGPGYNVVFVPFEDGVPEAGAWTPFATGFEGAGAPTPTTAEHRPVGLAQGPDGSLYISDDVAGRIWRVVYTGGG